MARHLLVLLSSVGVLVVAFLLDRGIDILAERLGVSAGLFWLEEPDFNAV
jgi:hypothetical protein